MIGEKLKQVREYKGYSRKEFAQIVKIPYSTYANYENGNREPSYDSLLQIANALDFSIAYFLQDRVTSPELWLSYEDSIHTLAKENGFNDNDWGIFLGLQTADGSSIVDLAKSDGVNLIELSKIRLQEKEKQKYAQMIRSFSQLNDSGQTEAVKRVEELTEIEKYKKKD